MNSVVHKSCSAASIPESSRLPGHWVDSGSVFYLPFRAAQGEDRHSGRRCCDSCRALGEECWRNLEKGPGISVSVSEVTRVNPAYLQISSQCRPHLMLEG